MSSKRMRNFFSAAAAAALASYGTAAHAIAYDISFDPFMFGGIMAIDVPPPCFTPINTVHSCTFNVLTLDFTDTAGNEWGISSPRIGAGSAVSIDSLGALVALSALLSPVTLISDTGGCSEFESSGTPSLQFAIDGVNSHKTNVVFRCGETSINTGTVSSITQIPEPATIALLGAALGVAGFVTRHRKLN
jgi:hypothetical protein